MGELVSGLVPSIPNSNALYIAIGIIGATVMPHNLYLHSSLVQTRKIERTPKGIWSAIKYNFIDSAVALNLALFVNAAILILAAAAFYKNGYFNVAEISDAHKFLEPLLGNKWAPILFAVALIAAGQSSTLTGTLAGQIVMEGYLNLRIQPWLRRMITRLLAVVPALFVIIYVVEDQTGELLVLSQVILSLQLGFAVIPLIHFVSDKQRMGEFAIGPWLKTGAWLIAATIVTLNTKLVWDQVAEWLTEVENPMVIWLTVVPVAAACLALLLYILMQPFVSGALASHSLPQHFRPVQLQPLEKPSYRRIVVTLDFSEADQHVLNNALTIGSPGAEFLLIHVVETAGALMMGQDIQDFETGSDRKNLERYASDLRSKGYTVQVELGFGSPKRIIPKLVKAFDTDLLVMGSHGHQMVKDLILGTSINTVRHAVRIPVLIV